LVLGNPNNKAFNLKALIDFKGGEELSINPKSKNYYFLPQATGEEAYFFDNVFGYYGIPYKYLNRLYVEVRDDPHIHGRWAGRGAKIRPKRPLYEHLAKISAANNYMIGDDDLSDDQQDNVHDGGDGGADGGGGGGGGGGEIPPDWRCR
jgi:hypothetical protein